MSTKQHGEIDLQGLYQCLNEAIDELTKEYHSATDRNEHLIALLKDLSGRVSSEDKGRIESALNLSLIHI